MTHRLPDEYIAAARQRSNAFAGQWTGTAGSLAADVRRLLLEREERELRISQLEQKGRHESRVVGLAGYAGSGKNAAAEALGGVTIGFADPLYAGLATMLGVPEEQLRARATKELPLGVGKSPRDLLRSLGTEWGRQLVRDDLWIWRARERILAARKAGASIVVICDVRFQNEAAFVRQELGGEIWWIDRPGIVPGDHLSDRSLKAEHADRVVQNAGTLDELAMAVRVAADQPRSSGGK